jgi:hypothetical protein
VIETVPLAVRGERLALYRTHLRSHTGFELSILNIPVFDESGHICRSVTFDDTDIDAALDELDQRHATIAGAAYTNADRVVAETAATLRRLDLEAWIATMSEDFISVDHRPIGYGTIDRSGLLALIRARHELTATNTHVVAKVYGSARASLVVMNTSSRSVEDSQYEWSFPFVFRHDDDGRVARLDVYSDDQWADALARFDDWSSTVSGR